MTSARTPLLYLAPWVDYGGTDKGTIDWFRWLDRDRYAPILVTTQPSANRRLGEIVPFAEEIWPLPDLMVGDRFPRAIVDLIVSRDIRLLHIMNSRLGFDLLPDLRALEHPPRTVVQLHVEEPEKTGYVRYVTTRYGNLVDCFSVTSHHLAEAVAGYGVSRDRIEVITTGVDAEREFSPALVRPRAGMDPGRIHVLYPGRLTDQKDPLLMVEVIDELSRRRRDFAVHAVGDGDMEEAVKRTVASRGLTDVIRFYPADELAPWYAAADLLLMTSRFEGVPYVVYEALAMGLPVVAPALAGNIELVEPEFGVLVEPRDSRTAYVEAVDRLLDDPELRTRMGAAGRATMIERHGLRKMADDHTALYDRLVAAGSPASARGAAVEATSANGSEPVEKLVGPLRLANRPSRDRPRVSVVVPCFNHGQWLGECLESVLSQDYPDVEVLVVDDASTDAGTTKALEAAEATAGVTVLSMPRNSGPSAARNRAIEHATGRYVLPVDADNALLPRALEMLVGQLQGASEDVGFIYQNLQFVGNREDYFEAPAYNLFTLLHRNYIDTSALLDRELFDHGVRYAEDILLGHEDWDFFLTLAALGVRGEPSHGKTLRYRKHGFTRSDTVDYASEWFGKRLAKRHPGLYSDREFASLKARLAPALTVIAHGSDCPLRDESWYRVSSALAAQTCGDLEVIMFADQEPPPADVLPCVRVLPRFLQCEPGRGLVQAEAIARGRYRLVTEAPLWELLADPACVERVLRMLTEADAAGDRTRAVAFVDLGSSGYPFGPVEPPAVGEPLPALHSIAWPLGDGEWPQPDSFSGKTVIDSLVGHFLDIGWSVACRSVTGSAQPRPARPGADAPLDWSVVRRRAEAYERKLKLEFDPLISEAGKKGIKRWVDAPWWAPAGTIPLVRHRAVSSEQRVVTNDLVSPPGFAPEYLLGTVNMHAVPGTVRLTTTDAGFELRPRGGEPTHEDMERTLGYVEQTFLPGFDALELARHAATGEVTLVCREEDPLLGAVGERQVIGAIESAPINPRRVADAGGPDRMWLLGLVRVVDRAARRHRYRLGTPPAGEVGWEIAALFRHPRLDDIPLYRHADGSLGIRPEPARRTRSSPGIAARWALAPLSWRGFSSRSARARAFGRRLGDVAAHSLPRVSSPPSATTHPVAWLRRTGGAELVPIYSAIHPVTGDQLLSRHPEEATEMGYRPPELLGYGAARAVATASLDRPPLSIPWASRFGEVVRWRS